MRAAIDRLISDVESESTTADVRRMRLTEILQNVLEKQRELIETSGGDDIDAIHKRRTPSDTDDASVMFVCLLFALSFSNFVFDTYY